MFRVVLGLSVALIGCGSEPGASRGEPSPSTERAPAASAASAPARALLDATELATLVAHPPPVQWFGVTLGGTKIGHASLGLHRDETSMALRSSLTVKRGETALALTEVRRYSIAPPHALQSVVNIEVSDDAKVEIRVERRGPAMERRRFVDGALVESGGLARSRETLADPLSQSFAHPDWLELDQRGVVVELDVDTGEDQETSVHVSRKSTAVVAGISAAVVEIELRRAGQAPTRTRIADSGLVLDATVGSFAFVAQDQRTARSDIVGLDLAAAGVKVERSLGDLSKLASIELAIGSKTDAPMLIPSAANQRIADGSPLRARVSAGAGARVSPAERASALTPTSSIDAAHPSIMAKARELRAAATSRRERVTAINNWVFGHLEKRLATDLSSASQVLAKATGDCTEHTLLFVALARAAGIPAREVSGLIYLGDERKLFGWHAWAEVELDGRWWRVDPSWGEFPAHPARLTLGIGDDTRWIALIGGLNLEILAVDGS